MCSEIASVFGGNDSNSFSLYQALQQNRPALIIKLLLIIIYTSKINHNNYDAFFENVF